MNTLNYISKTILAALLSLILLSCVSKRPGIKSLELGISKSEVINKMGDAYKVETLRKTDQGYLEVLCYTHYAQKDGKLIPSDYYMLHILNGNLVEVNKVNAEKRHHYPHPKR